MGLSRAKAESGMTEVVRNAAEITALKVRLNIKIIRAWFNTMKTKPSLIWSCMETV